MENNHEETMETQPLELDPVKVEAFNNQLKGEENLPVGAAAGFAAAIVGGIIWAAVTVLTKYQIGWMAIGVGILVGYVVQKSGRGVSGIFGWLGAILSLFGCALGNLLSVIGFVAIQESLAFFDVLQSVFTQPGAVFSVMKATFQPMDVLFYLIAMYEGYQFSFRQFSDEELLKLAREEENP